MFSKSLVLFAIIATLVSPLEGIERFLLITGTARSGTFFTTKVFRECGLDILHENIGQDGACSWLMAVDSEVTPWGPGRSGVEFQHIFHQIRDPIKTISSVYTTEPKMAWEYIMKYIPEITWQDPKLERCAKYWYFWNLRAEQLAEFSYPVEDIENQWEKIESILEMKLDKSALNRVPKDANTRGEYTLKVTWKLLQRELDPYLFNQIQEMAQKYGYPIEDKS